MIEFGPFRDAVGVGRSIGRAEFAKPARQFIPLLKFDPGGGFGDVTLSRRKIVTGYRQAEQMLWMGERVIGGDAAASSRTHEMELLQAEKFDQTLQIFGSRARVVLRRRVGIVIVAPRIGDNTIAGIREHGLLI